MKEQTENKTEYQMKLIEKIKLMFGAAFTSLLFLSGLLDEIEKKEEEWHEQEAEY